MEKEWKKVHGDLTEMLLPLKHNGSSDISIRHGKSRLEHPRHYFLDFFFFFCSHFTLKNNLVGFKLLSGDSFVA